MKFLEWFTMFGLTTGQKKALLNLYDGKLHIPKHWNFLAADTQTLEWYIRTHPEKISTTGEFNV